MNMFSNALAIQRKGECLKDLSQHLAEVVQACRNAGKSATLTLKLKVSPSSSDGTVFLTDEISVKLPAPKKDSSLFFVADDGSLTRNDPRQLPLQLKSIEGGKAPLELPAPVANQA